MKQFGGFIKTTGKDLWRAIARFPLTVLCLAGITAISCYVIYLRNTPPLILEKLALTFLVAAILAMAAQFAVENVSKLGTLRAAAHIVSAALAVGFFFLLRPAPRIGSEIGVRSAVAVFALICAILWLPSVNGRTDFNRVALTHFKAVFTSALYAAVLSGGIAAIISAVDILLFHVDSVVYRYMLSVVWILFAGVCDLSLLPEFGREEDAQREERAGKYPRFLEILISYIAIPLMGAYTVVLTAYFVKILITHKWPSGQLGPLILAYSAVGLVLLVLASLAQNRFAVWYRRLFPKALVPIVILQMVSVGIRLRAYGVTESRYYLALFGIFSLVIGVILSFRPVAGNRLIALLAAGFAVVSIIPPVDAFNVSRHSQISRLERILQAEGMLSGGVLTPKSSASEETKKETTSILSYLDGRAVLDQLSWLPENFEIYEDMETTFGFASTYSGYDPNTKYSQLFLAPNELLAISGYDVSTNLNSSRYDSDNRPVSFTVRDIAYRMSVSRISDQDARVSVQTADGTELVGTDLYSFSRTLIDTTPDSKSGLPAEQLTLDTEQNGYRLRVIFQSINVDSGSSGMNIDYSMTVLFGAP